ncbi:MAG: LysE family translocator [Gemmatimonadota bacterium]
MIATILMAVTLGAFAGAAPGPYTTMVVGTSLQRGFREGVKLAFVPMVSDAIPLVLTVFILDALNWSALTLLGITGGTLIGMIGVRFLRDEGPPELEGREPFQAATFGHAAAGTFFSPSPWLFWLVLAGPLTLRAMERSTAEAAVFVGVLFAMNIGMAMFLAWLAAHSRRFLAPSVRHRFLQVAGVGLIVAGLVLVWQAMEGNFQAMMAKQEGMREAIEHLRDRRG